MKKFALAAGIVAEWVYGPSVDSALGLAHAAARAFIATVLAWLVLEALRAVYRTVMSYDDKPRLAGR